MIDYRNHDYVQPILNFLKKINIPYQFAPIDIETYVPGINIQNGTLQIDLKKLSFPGDLLYEAGRIALAPAAVRPSLTHPIDNQLDFDIPTISMMTIAWSYAAALDSETPLEVLFHPEGYKGQNENIKHGFQTGQYIGLPMLQYLGMAFDANNAAQKEAQPFPVMQSWLRP